MSVQRPRTRSRRNLRIDPAGLVVRHPIGSGSGISPNTGPLAAAAWLAGLDIVPSSPRWSVEVQFDPPDLRSARDPDLGDIVEEPLARFKLDVYSEEWGYQFWYAGRSSWIRVTDIRFAHGRDEHELLGVTPPLRNIGGLLRQLEQRYDLTFPRDRVTVRSSIPGSQPSIRAWARTL